MWSKLYCNCITCDSIGKGAIDHRDGMGHVNEPCTLCAITGEPEDPHYEKRMVVGRPFFIPDVAREFLGRGQLCRWCIALIHWEVHRGFKACWATAPPEVIELAVLKVLRHALNAAIRFRSPAFTEHREYVRGWMARWEAEQAKRREETPDLPIITIRIRPRAPDAQH